MSVRKAVIGQFYQWVLLKQADHPSVFASISMLSHQKGSGADISFCP